MAFPYVRSQADWKNANSATGGGDTSTPITEAVMDNIEAGIKSLSDILALVDAAEDMIIGSGVDAYKRLAKGPDDSVLSVATGALSYRKIVNAMVDAAAAIAVSKLAAGASNGQALRTLGGVPTWDGSYATTLPAGPVDGQQAILVDSTSAPTYAWLFRYNAGSGSTFKWECIGGVPLIVRVNTDQSTTTTGSWLDLTTVGPSFTVPNAGDWECFFGSDGYHSASGGQIFVGPAIGAGTPAVNIAMTVPAASSLNNMGAAPHLFAGLAVSNEIRLRYFSSSAGTANWAQRWIRVMPKRVS